jgi:hypothetical protein
MMFSFTLYPVDQIHPWGEPSNAHLHWFGLTFGTYYLQVGPDQLLRYSDECNSRCIELRPAAKRTPYVEYQIARLYEDVFEILPHILEPIPVELLERASNLVCRSWSEKYREWMEA